MAERTLNPTRMDHPGNTTYTCDWTTAVSTAAGTCCGATFDEAPLLLAAAHSSDAIAEVASAVDLAEGAAPRVKCRGLKRSGIVPTCEGGLGVLGFTLFGNGSWFWQLSSIAIALGHLVVATPH